MEMKVNIQAYLRKKLGIPNLESRLDSVEERLDFYENEIRRVQINLRELHSFKDRTRPELDRMSGDIEGIIGCIDSLIRYNEYQQDVFEAKKLLRRLRYIRTKIANALEAVA